MNKPRIYEPTPEQIARETAKIRLKWSDAEYYKRLGIAVTDGKPRPFEIPQCKVGE